MKTNLILSYNYGFQKILAIRYILVTLRFLNNLKEETSHLFKI